jgi:hypothetical protein
MRRYARTRVALPATMAAAIACATIDARGSGAVSGDPTAALVRFLTPDPAPLTSYRGTRRLQASARGGKLQASLHVWTELHPRRGFEYRVIAEDGAESIRSRVLHPVLDAERRSQAPGDIQQGGLTRENYSFEPPSYSRDGLLRVPIHPRRDHVTLVNGAMFLRPGSGDLVRVEGRLSKRPSFWTRQVDIVREYARIAGVRVPVSMESTAQLLIIGTSHFSMTWEYESINGMPVGMPASAVATSGK